MSTSTRATATARDAAPTGKSADLGWTLSVVFRAYAKAAKAATADLPGGPRGHQVLATAARDEPLTQSALANRLGIDRTVMTYLLDDLVRAGLVERQPDPTDRRSHRVAVTSRGETVLAELNRRIRQTEDQLLSGLDEAERAMLCGLLDRVAGYANDLDPIDHPCDAIADIVQTEASP